MDNVIHLPGKSPASAFIEAEIDGEFYFNAQHGVDAAAAEAGVMAPKIDSLDRLVFCVLVFKGGLTVTGGAVCADGNLDMACQNARTGAIESAKRRLTVKDTLP